jgi:putative endonuclease
MEKYLKNNYNKTMKFSGNSGRKAREFKSWKWYVYIIECKDGTYYTGRTWDVNLRYEQHLSGLGGVYTAEHGVKALVYYEEHSDYQEACKREIQIKNWSQDKKRKILIDNFKL